MNKYLGKIFLLCLLPLSLFANQTQASFKLSTNKTTAYIKEAVEISFVAKQLDHTDVMFFFLEPKKSDDYEIKLLNKKTTELGYHNYTTKFTYLLFPLKAKKISVDFNFTIKVASDEAVAQVFQGSRDNTKWIETIDTTVAIKPLFITVKKLAHKVDLVGDFTLKSKLLKDTITKYDSANINYNLIGTGYKDKNFNIIKKIPNTTIFSQQNDAFSLATKDGYKISREYTYAIVAQKDFTIPEVNIKVYSPKLQKYYTLSAKAYHVKVQNLDISTLVDKEESPKTKMINEDLLKDIFAGILLFISGFLTAKYYPYLKSTKKKKEEKFQDIKESEDADTLILVLLNNYKHKKLHHFIDELELQKYKKSSKSFKEIKKQLLESLK